MSKRERLAAYVARISRAKASCYSSRDLQALFGVSDRTVRDWWARGYLGASRRGRLRVSEADVLRFIFNGDGKYSLARVHQEWFRYLVFGQREGVANGL
jgi:hypothetical protein